MLATGCPCCAYPQRPAVSRGFGFSVTSRVGTVDPGSDSTASSHGLVLDGGTVVDPRDGSFAADVSVRIEGGRIVEVGSAGAVDPSADRVDVTGAFIVPGYNDMHSHALNLDDPSASLALMLAEGVTGFRQMSGSPALLKKRRDNALPIGAAAPAVLEMPGNILTPLNAGTRTAVGAEIRRQREQGADFVKMVMADADVFMAAVEEAVAVGIPILGHLQDGVDVVAASRAGFRSIEHLGPGSSVWTSCSTVGDRLLAQARRQPGIKGPPFKIPFLERIVARRMLNLLVNPAAYTDTADVARIQAAVDTFDEERAAGVAAQLAEQGTWQVPTLVRLRSMQLAGGPEYDDDELLTYMPARDIKRWRSVTKKFLARPAEVRATYAALYPRQLALAKLFADAGVPMMTGTDGGAMMAPGLTLRQEFGELAKAGLSPLTILQMATVNAARYLGRQKTMGTVQSGADADLVVLEANPLDDVENLHRITAVVRAGRYYSATALGALRSGLTARHQG
jgi:imidazolonepropionase-like amidohydrolase